MKARVLDRFAPVLTGAVVLALAACSNPVGDGGGHRVASDVVVTEADGTTVIARTQANAAWTGGPITVPAQGHRDVRIFFVAPNGDRFQLPASGASHTLHVEVGNTDVARFEATSREVARISGRAPGTTTARVYLWHGVHPAGHEDFLTPPLTVQVVP